MNSSPPDIPYMEAAAEPVTGRPALLGIPFDQTASFRKGAALGPDAIRQVSNGLETYSPSLDRAVSYTHLRAHETLRYRVFRLML